MMQFTIDSAMDRHQGTGRTLNQYALVSYIPEPLASFLDDLRLQLTPGCNPHAHLTVLPPRPFSGVVEDAVRDLQHLSLAVRTFNVVLGEIEVFPVSNVIYLGILGGESQVRALHGELNSGLLEHLCPYPFHPHVTLAQDFDVATVEHLAETARKVWATWTGSRTFKVRVLSFVQNVAIGRWDDLASVELSEPPNE